MSGHRSLTIITLLFGISRVCLTYTSDVTHSVPLHKRPIRDPKLPLTSRQIPDPMTLGDVTLSLRDVNDEDVRRAVIGSSVQLLLTVRLSRSSPLSHNSGVLPWTCRAVSDDSTPRRERYLLLDGCGAGDVMAADAGLQGVTWQDAAEFVHSSRSEFFSVFRLGDAQTLHFECDVMRSQRDASPPSCLREAPHGGKIVNRKRKRTRRQFSLSTTRTGPIDIVVGEYIEPNPYLETVYFYEADVSKSTTTPASATSRTTTRISIMTQRTTRAATSLAASSTTSTLPPTTPTIRVTQPTTARTTPLVLTLGSTTNAVTTAKPTLPLTTPTLPAGTQTTKATTKQPTRPSTRARTTALQYITQIYRPTTRGPIFNTNQITVRMPDAAAAMGSGVLMESLYNSPLLVGLLVGMGILILVLIFIAVPTAILCFRFLQQSQSIYGVKAVQRPEMMSPIRMYPNFLHRHFGSPDEIMYVQAPVDAESPEPHDLHHQLGGVDAESPEQHDPHQHRDREEGNAAEPAQQDPPNNARAA